MQLNSQTLNNCVLSFESQYHLPIYDHKLAKINTEIFVFGKNIQNFFIQVKLHKINMNNMRVEHIFTANSPSFDDFIMFSFEQLIYFWGKTPQSQKNQFFQFDGSKFNKILQNDHIPDIIGPYTFSIFSHQFLLLFGYLRENQFKNQFYCFDIKKRHWKQVICNFQFPDSQKACLHWQNGQGYLLLQSVYFKQQKSYKRNTFYQLTFKRFDKPILQCLQIQFNRNILESTINFSNIVSIEEKSLLLLGGQTNKFQNQNLTNLNSNTHKIVYKFDLEFNQWVDQIKYIPIKGQNSQLISYGKKLFAFGGTINGNLCKQVQSYDFAKNLQQSPKFYYQQSLCYYCQSAFTYKQQSIYNTVVQRQFETFFPKNKIENKFYRKISQSITSEFQALGILIDFIISLESKFIKINLCQQIKQNAYFHQIKKKISNQTSDVLIISGNSSRNYMASSFKQISDRSDEFGTYFDQKNQYFNINLIKAKIASYKFGHAFLFITQTKENQTFIGYSSVSQTDFRQQGMNSFSQIYYTIQVNQQLSISQFSSKINRQIIFENIKLHFQKPQDYQQVFTNYETNTFGQSNILLMIFGVTNLEKSFKIELQKNNYFQDIQIKGLGKNNHSNSFRDYLKHIFMNQQQGTKIYLQDELIQPIRPYAKYEQMLRSNQIKQILITDELSQKIEQQDTHFSTNHDELMSWKKPDCIEKCKLYEIYNSKKIHIPSAYKNIFLYKNKRLVKTIQSKRKNICGVIQLSDQVAFTINGKNFASKQDQKKIFALHQSISMYLADQKIFNCDSSDIL